jgi:hypothetical protein
MYIMNKFSGVAYPARQICFAGYIATALVRCQIRILNNKWSSDDVGFLLYDISISILHARDYNSHSTQLKQDNSEVRIRITEHSH